MNFHNLTFGPPRYFRPIVPRMWPQQMPLFRYAEVAEVETAKKLGPIVSIEEYEAVEKRDCQQ